ncbi:MAG: hypothetical protein PF447_12755 [Spirochaetaceae bacterium]|nr:hypothetical protein [Spirochaetaceae bacterium]
MNPFNLNSSIFGKESILDVKAKDAQGQEEDFTNYCHSSGLSLLNRSLD